MGTARRRTCCLQGKKTFDGRMPAFPKRYAEAAAMIFRSMTKQDDAALAAIIRDNLESYGLDVPGTAYFDPDLDRLSAYYLSDPAARCYLILTDDTGTVAGGVGLAAFAPFEHCAELQKLYLADAFKGAGLGYALIEAIEDKARSLGYRRMYLETHDCLAAAVHLYEKCGYRRIERPDGVVHSSMNRFYLKEL